MYSSLPLIGCMNLPTIRFGITFHVLTCSVGVASRDYGRLLRGSLRGSSGGGQGTTTQLPPFPLRTAGSPERNMEFVPDLLCCLEVSVDWDSWEPEMALKKKWPSRFDH